MKFFRRIKQQYQPYITIHYIKVEEIIKIKNKESLTNTNYFIYIIIFQIMNQYKLQSKKGDGAFSQVFMAQSIKTGKYVAIKCMKTKYQNIERVKKLRQIQALRHLSPHEHIIKLIQVLYDQPSGKLALVFELMEQNLYQCLKSKKSQLTNKKIKYYMFQLLKAIQYIHKKGIFHRDIKPQNVLISGDHVKLADFGSCKGSYTQHPYTQYISTRWYRAPQCLMTEGYYDFKMDIWGYGCILFQMITKYPLFAGKNQVDQIHKIHNILGTPNQEILQKFKTHPSTYMDFNFPTKKGTGLERLLTNTDKQTIDFLYKLLAYDPLDRLTADEALKHQYFHQLYQVTSSKQFRSTVFTTKFSHTENQTVNNQQIPQNTLKLKKVKPTLKKQVSKGMIDDQATLLPPIHQVGVEMKLNFYGHSTLKGPDNIFKKTTNKIQKKKDQSYVILGKKAV